MRCTVKQDTSDSACSLLEDRDVLSIMDAIIKLMHDGVYTDPFINTPKHAAIWREETNRPPVEITTKVAKQKRRRERRMKDKSPKPAPENH